eukprot:1358670-Amphidinium_carterae.1
MTRYAMQQDWTRQLQCCRILEMQLGRLLISSIQTTRLLHKAIVKCAQLEWMSRENKKSIGIHEEHTYIPTYLNYIILHYNTLHYLPYMTVSYTFLT